MHEWYTTKTFQEKLFNIGAVLAQTVDDQEHPVAYASRKLLPRERRYATVEKESLAVKWTILKFAPYLLGRTFTLVTDHRPLSWIAHHSSANARVARWAIAHQPFSFTVKYRPGAGIGSRALHIKCRQKDSVVVTHSQWSSDLMIADYVWNPES